MIKNKKFQSKQIKRNFLSLQMGTGKNLSPICSNKKSQVPSTLVWIIATFAILFILIIFLFLAGFLSFGKEKPKAEVNYIETSNLIATEKLIYFLDSSIQDKTIYSLLLNSGSSDEFQDAADKFLNKEFLLYPDGPYLLAKLVFYELDSSKGFKENSDYTTSIFAYIDEGLNSYAEYSSINVSFNSGKKLELNLLAYRQN